MAGWKLGRSNPLLPRSHHLYAGSHNRSAGARGGAQGTRGHRQGERFIWHNLHRLRHDPFELVGFELILPTLLMEALEMGLDVPAHTCGYGQVRLKKLALIPPNLMYSPQITTVHSLEFLGKSGEQEKLRQAKAINGSLGNSPAATAYLLLTVGQDEQAGTLSRGCLASQPVGQPICIPGGCLS